VQRSSPFPEVALGRASLTARRPKFGEVGCCTVAVQLVSESRWKIADVSLGELLPQEPDRVGNRERRSKGSSRFRGVSGECRVSQVTAEFAGKSGAIPSVNFFPKSRTKSGIGREGRRFRLDSFETPVQVGSAELG
jgi:hypothetical protein